MSVPPRRSRLLAAAGFAVLMLAIAASRGADATWDLRNYHLYNAFALLNKQAGSDIAPAHMQTWFPPMLDLLYYGLTRAVTFVPLLNALAAVPHAIAIVLAYWLALRLIRPSDPIEHGLVILAVLIGATGAAALPTIATTMSETVPAALFLGALLVLVPADAATTPTSTRVFVAGLLAGAACGFKLTTTYAAMALAVALLTIPPIRAAPARIALLALGGTAGTVAVAGWFWSAQIMHYGNPLFPMYNNIANSPLVAPYRYIDDAFLPHSMAQAFTAPWAWSLSLYRGVSESRLRDPRFALAILAALVWLGQSALNRSVWPSADRRWTSRFMVVWFLVGFALWRLQFSVFRYLSLLEFLTGTLILLAAIPAIRRSRAQPVALGAGVALLAMLAVVTVYPYTQRVTDGRFWDVDLGPLGSDAMVLSLDNAPVAYLAAFASPSTRFVATNDYFMTLDGSNPMQAKVEAAIAGHTGPLWGVESPTDQRGAAATLAHYQLRRGECRPVRSNLSPEPLRICSLLRE